METKIECSTVARKWYSKRERAFHKIDFGSPTEALRVRELLKKDWAPDELIQKSIQRKRLPNRQYLNLMNFYIYIKKRRWYYRNLTKEKDSLNSKAEFLTPMVLLAVGGRTAFHHWPPARRTSPPPPCPCRCSCRSRSSTETASTRRRAYKTPPPSFLERARATPQSAAARH
jgi:hypothetical protein